MIKNLVDLNKIKEKGLKSIFPDKMKISVGMATCGLATGSQEVYDELQAGIERNKLEEVLQL